MLALASSLLLLLLCDSPGSVTSINDEGSALLLFKSSITHDPYESLSNWNSSDETPCLWFGIACQGKKVVSLSIPKKKISGFIPPSSIGSLHGLRHLNLRNNDLHGSLPHDLFKYPGLQSLVLFGNSFSGSIPNEIGNLKFLQNLDLSQNIFTGLLPKSLIRCRKLRRVVLSQNNFTGSFPKGFGTNLRSLETLNLSFNMFYGSIPSDMGMLSSLQGTVDFSHNRFNGSIPASFGNLPEKVYIDLTFNDLSGSIPQNGALINRGPTAFIGNPGLCGPPLKTQCSSDLNPSFPKNSTDDDDDIDHKKIHGSGRGISRSALIAIVVCDLVGIFAAGLLFSCCYSRLCGYYGVKDETDGGEKPRKGSYFCFRKYDESETPSENAEQQQPKHELVAFDRDLGFDLDELLKASAFVLGKSGVGIVYKVVLEDGLNLVVRRLGEGGSQMFKEFQTEIEAIGKLRHPNIITLRAYYWSLEEKLLIYDYLPNGNLFSAIHGQGSAVPFTPLPWSIRLRIIKGMARGLAYIHESSPKKYVHGDLKPTNILLNQNMEPQISNFGVLRLANLVAPTSPPSHSNRTAAALRRQLSSTTASEMEPPAMCYQPPEVLKTVKASQKWDVYSFGVILLEMITGRMAMVQVGSVEMGLVQWIQMCIEEKKPVGDVLDAGMGEEDGEDEVVSVLKIAMACVNGCAERRPAMRHVADALERLCVS